MNLSDIVICHTLLLSPQAELLTLVQVLRLSDQEAYDAFKAIGFTENDEALLCDVRGNGVLQIQVRAPFKCKACGHSVSFYE